MRHSVAWYVYIISLHYHDFNLTTTPTQRHLSLKLPSCKVQKIVFVQWWYNDGLPDELATISYLLKTFLGFNTEHSAQNVPICRCMIYKFDICQLYFLFDLLILQINKNLPNFIIALFLRCHVYGPKWFVMIHKREEMLTISWIEYEWNDIVICCLTPSLINKRPYKGLLSFNKINTNLDQSVRLQKSLKYL